MCLFCRLELCFDVRVIIFFSSYWLLTVCFVIWFKIVVFSLNVFHYYCLFHLLKCIYSCRFKSIVAWFFSQYYVFDNAMMAKIFTRINKLLNWNMLFFKFFFILLLETMFLPRSYFPFSFQTRITSPMINTRSLKILKH